MIDCKCHSSRFCHMAAFAELGKKKSLAVPMAQALAKLKSKDLIRPNFISYVAVAVGTIGLNGPLQALSAETPSALPIPKVQSNGGIGFQSQSSGSANTVSGYWFAPLKRSAKGDLLFLDLSGNLNIGGSTPQANDVNVGASMRLGYRWLKPDQRWIYGVNAGIDTRPAYNSYTWQAGVGAEALSRSFEIRLNGYIPFANTNDLYQSGWGNASLLGDRLILDGFNRYVVAVGRLDAEAGIPLKRWKNASLWTYGGYYYQYGDYLAGSSGVRARAEMRVGNQLALGATLSYDSLFETQANGYIRYGSKPINGRPKEAIDQAETNFLALLALPVDRQADVRLASVQVNLPGTTAINPATGQPWVVRCAGTTSGNYVVNCTYANALAAIQAGTSDVVLLANGIPSTNLAGTTLRLPAGTSLTSGSNAPTLNTQFGSANLGTIFGTSTGSAPSFSNGVISIGSNTTIAGLGFTNASITNYSTSNVLIAANNFVGSYSDNPTNLADAQAFGAINASTNAMAAIDFNGISNVTIENNTFLYPQVQIYNQQASSGLGGLISICNQANLCLSGNAIRLNRSGNVVISNNRVNGALEEAFSINNSSGSTLIAGNLISNIRIGPSSDNPNSIFAVQTRGDQLNMPRSLHTASTLPDGKILIAGGYNKQNLAVSSAEIYDPNTGKFSETGEMQVARIAATATQLSDGRILMVGGQDSSGNALSSVEIYDPLSGTFLPGANLGVSRINSTATTLADGTVLVTGGYTGAINASSTGTPLASAEVYDPSKNTWQVVGSMSTTRRNHIATPLGDGTVLIAGGYNGSYINTPEIYNPLTQSFLPTATSMEGPRRYPTANMLPSGKVLWAGGFKSTTNGALATTELYTSNSAISFSSSSSMNTARGRHTATNVAGGDYVLVAGGFDINSTTLSSAEIYNSSANYFSQSASMNVPRYRHTDSLLPNGSVLITGGDDSSGALSSAEIYVPFFNY